MTSIIARAIDIPQTPKKPRREAMNLCLDDGLSAGYTRDLLSVAGDVIDVIRIGRAAALIFPQEWLVEKASVCAAHQVELQIGGPLYEVAFLQGKVDAYFEAVAAVGVHAVELSENVIRPTAQEMARDIRKARDAGLIPYFEYGRKYPDKEPFRVDEAERAIVGALQAGSKLVQVERAEIDLLVDKPDALVQLAERVGLTNLCFEIGPRTPSYPEKLLAIFGASVNLANVVLDPPGALDGILLIENARRGMDRSVGYSFLATGAKLPFRLDSTVNRAAH